MGPSLSLFELCCGSVQRMKNKLEYEEFEHMCIVDGSVAGGGGGGDNSSSGSTQQQSHPPSRGRGGHKNNEDDDEEEEFGSKPAKVNILSNPMHSLSP